MNILIVKLSPIYGLNSSMLRSLALTKGLITLGNTVDFVTIPVNESHTVYNGFDFFSDFKIIEVKGNEAYVGLIKDTKNNKLKKHIYSYARKIYHGISFFDHTKSIANKIKLKDLPSDKYDLVISISDPKSSHLAVKNLIRQGLKYKKWIQYWGDPLALDISHTNKFPLFFNKIVEQNLFFNSDLILYASPITLIKQKELYKNQSDKMKFIPTPYIEKKIYPKTNNKKYQIGYFGDFVSKVRNIQPLYDACVDMKEKVDLTIVGNSDLELTAQENVNIYARQEVSKFEEKTDLLVCMLNNSGTQIPGKVFHYASTNKPILLILDGEYGKVMGEYFENTGRYFICSNNEQDIKKTIDVIRSESVDEAPLDLFNSTNVAEKILNFTFL